MILPRAFCVWAIEELCRDTALQIVALSHVHEGRMPGSLNRNARCETRTPEENMTICSKHWWPVRECPQCEADIQDLLPDFFEKVKKAEKAGLRTCLHCGFESYRTTDLCPKCGERFSYRRDIQPGVAPR